jgi:hypothetical protein
MNRKQKKHREAALAREAAKAEKAQAEQAHQQAMQMMQKQLDEARNPTGQGAQATQAMIPEDQARAQAIAQRHQREDEAGRKAALDIRTRLQSAQGFSPEQARAMQYEAHKGIQRQEQAAQRNLVGAQGVQGIGGRSGIGYAQRRDLNRGYAAQHGQAQRDFNRLNREEGRANVGAEYAAEQGEKSRLGTDWETALEREERKKWREANPNYAKEAYQQFSRM